MFTGLIEAVGTIESITSIGDAARLVVALDNDTFLHDAQMGESISVSGVCLTVVEHDARHFTLDVVEETLRRTTLGSKTSGSKVNLERAMRVGDRLGGHIVQGHVDGVGSVTSVRPEGTGDWITFEPPFEMMRLIVEKGSICIDGISLTVANVAYSRFSIALIPHTKAVTTAREWLEGASVNLEADVLAKHVERLLSWRSS